MTEKWVCIPSGKKGEEKAVFIEFNDTYQRGRKRVEFARLYFLPAQNVKQGMAEIIWLQDFFHFASDNGVNGRRKSNTRAGFAPFISQSDPIRIPASFVCRSSREEFK